MIEVNNRIVQNYAMPLNFKNPSAGSKMLPISLLESIQSVYLLCFASFRLGLI
jgi:hypothetical protein